MAYAREGEDGSDIYLYTSDGGWTCADCSLICAACRAKGEYEVRLDGPGGAIALILHLRSHIVRGDTVPDHVFARILCEMFGIPFKTHAMRAVDEWKTLAEQEKEQS